MQVSKNGFFYALDAATGKLLRAKNYTTVSWATHVDMATGRPVEVPEARFGKTGKAVDRAAGRAGRTQLASDVLQPPHRPGVHARGRDQHGLRAGPELPGRARVPPMRARAAHRRPSTRTCTPMCPRTSRAFLIAWDPVARSRGVALGTARHDRLGRAGHGRRPGVPGCAAAASSRPIATAMATKLWSTDPQTGVVAAPVSYEVDGEQYIA